MVHDLQVQVGLAAVAGVTALGKLLPSGDALATVHATRAATKVREGDVLAVAVVDDEVIAHDAVDAEELTQQLDTEGVGDARGAAPGVVVAFAAIGPHHGPVTRSEDRRPQPG